MKKFILISALFVAISSFAQEQEQKATIYFKNGSIKSGFAKIRNDKIKFKLDTESNKTTYDYRTVDSVRMRENSSDATFYYKSVKDKKKPVLLQILVRGKATLFTNLYSTKSGFNVYQGSRKFITDNQLPESPDTHSNPNISAAIGSPIDYYYIQKPNDKLVTYIGQWGDPYFGKSLKKGVLEYFKDCPELISKIRNKEYYRDEINTIVEFYNENCK